MRSAPSCGESPGGGLLARGGRAAFGCIFERLARRGPAKDSVDIVEFGGLECEDDRRAASSGVETSKK